MRLSLQSALFTLLLPFSTSFFREHADGESVDKFKQVVEGIVQTHEEERLSILTNHRWADLGSWGSIRQLTNGAYHLALIAIEQVHEGRTPREELSALNFGLMQLSPFMKDKHLEIEETDTTLAINFTQEEQFENGTMEKTPNSLRYLPIMGMLFNHNPHSPFVLAKFVQACQVYHPVEIIRGLAFGYEVKKPEGSLAESVVVAEMLRLESHATELKYAINRLIVMYAECLALSQMPYLKDTEPKHIAPAMPHFTTSLNLLQRKFKRAADLLKGRHDDL